MAACGVVATAACSAGRARHRPMRFHGSYGDSTELDVERYLRDARVAC